MTTAIAPNSQYNSAQPYLVGQQVLVGSLVYQAILAVPPNNAPPNGTYWVQVAVPQAPLGSPAHFAFPFSHATGSAALAAGVETGIVLNAGDLITNIWFEVDTAFNGTTPLADVGTFSSTLGIYKELDTNCVDLTVADAAVTDNTGLDKIGGVQLGSGIAGFPLRCTATGTELELVVSENGAKGGTASGATVGAAVLHVIVQQAA